MDKVPMPPDGDEHRTDSVPAPVALSGKADAEEVRRLLAELIEGLDPWKLYRDPAVRAALDRMDPGALRRLVGAAGYVDGDVNLAGPVNCRVEDLFGVVAVCARSFVDYLTSYAQDLDLAARKGRPTPHWVVGDSEIVLEYDGGLRRLRFRREPLALIEASYSYEESGHGH